MILVKLKTIQDILKQNSKLDTYRMYDTVHVDLKES